MIELMNSHHCSVVSSKPFASFVLEIFEKLDSAIRGLTSIEASLVNNFPVRHPKDHFSLNPKKVR